MPRRKYLTIREFVDDAPLAAVTSLETLHDTIAQLLPEAEQGISYNIPCFKIGGKPVVYFAGYTTHVSIYPLPKDITGIENDIAKYKAGKGTLRFPLAKPLPIAFIRKVVKQLAREKKRRSG